MSAEELNTNALAILCEMWQFVNSTICSERNANANKINIIKGNENNGDILHAFKTYILQYTISKLPPDIKLGVWTILYASRFLTLPPFTLLSNSANCKFTLSKGTTIANTSIEHCVKVVPCALARKIDFIGIDNINGCVMNQIAAKEPTIALHVMTYVDSFWTYVSTDTTQWEPMAVANHTADAITTKAANALPYIPDKHDVYVNITQVIQGKALKDLKYSLDYFDVLFQHFPPFFIALKSLGNTYGFIHNDLHLGNIMYDTQSSSFRIIDYGRCVFDITDNQHINNFTDKFIVADVWKNSFQWIVGKTPRTYVNMIDALGKMSIPTTTYRNEIKAKGIDVTSAVITGALDLAMLCGNMARDVLSMCDLNKNVDWVIALKAVITSMINFGSQRSVILPFSKKTHSDVYSIAKTKASSSPIISQDADIQEFLKCLMEGLYYLRIYLTTIVSPLPTADSGDNLQIQLETLKNNGIHTYFQYSGSNIEAFWDAIQDQPRVTQLGGLRLNTSNPKTYFKPNFKDRKILAFPDTNIIIPQNTAEILNRNYTSCEDERVPYSHSSNTNTKRIRNLQNSFPSQSQVN